MISCNVQHSAVQVPVTSLPQLSYGKSCTRLLLLHIALFLWFFGTVLSPARSVSVNWT